MITCAVCDDDSVFTDRIREKIEEYAKAKDISCKIDVYSSGEEVLEHINQKYNVYFLDMQMKELDGMKVAESIRKVDSRTVIVFISGYIQYAAKGYCVNAIRYILKPQLEEEFDDCMDAVVQQLSGIDEVLNIHIGTKDITLKLEEILYIENVKRKVMVHMKDGKTVYETYAKITELAEKLHRNDFIYCHAAYLVNARMVEEISQVEFILKTGECVPISRQKSVQAQKDYYLYKVKSNVFR